MASPSANLHDRIERERKAAAPYRTRWESVKRYRAYARGLQRGTLNADQIMIMQTILSNSFSDNILAKILNEHRNRLRPTRYAVEDRTCERFLHDTWIRNQFVTLIANAVWAMLRDGNHALALDWEPSDDPANEWGGWVRLSRVRWWDGTSGVFIKRGPHGEYEYAINEWSDPISKIKYRTIYFPGEIRRYRMGENGANWELYRLSTDPEGDGTLTGGPIPWRKADGSPMAVPYVHLTNGSDDDTFYGVSIFAGGALAFQDQINAIQHDMTAAAMLTGSPQTWSKGFPQPVDTTTQQAVPITTGPGKHHHAESKDAFFGVLAPGDMSQLRDAYLLKVTALCRNTDTPLHTIIGQWPSGEALLRAEMPIVQSSRTRIATLGPDLATAAHRATEIANAFGDGPEIDEQAPITTVFDDPEMLDPIARWALVEKATGHVSEREALRIAGYAPGDIDRIMQERAAEADERQERADAAFGAGPDLAALLKGAQRPTEASDEETDAPNDAAA